MPDPLTSTVNASSSGNPGDELRQEYERRQALFEAQPAIIQRFLEAQGRQLADAFIEHAPSVRFMLPDRVVCDPGRKGDAAPVAVPHAARSQAAGSLRDRLSRRDVHDTLRQRLSELEQSPDAAVSASARLIRHVTATHMVRNMLPSGRSVTYVAAEGDEIPTIPVSTGLEPESAITAKTDAIVEEGQAEAGRGDLLVPYVPAARRFYLPQWVAFDDQDNILVSSMREAQAHVGSMQRFLYVIHAAHSLAPYILEDEEYLSKRYGMLGQLINQGRALARYQTQEIVQAIKQRAAKQSLNRGLSLDLPYFDDQSLEMKTHHIVIIPAGRIMFVPAFVVRAAIEEQAKVAQDTRFSQSTRKHLLAELQMLGDAFESSGK
jgi:hypothetical protein